MLYKHWWACYPTENAYAAAWPQIMADSLRIVTRAVAYGIAVCGPDGYRSPIIDRVDGIALGGDAAHRRHAEPLLLPAPHRNPYPSPCGSVPATTGSVDTARHPYDTVVAAILLRCHVLQGHSFSIRSDGGWNTEWTHGARHGHLPARGLLTDLFGPLPDTSPLTWPPSPHRPTLQEGHTHA